MWACFIPVRNSRLTSAAKRLGGVVFRELTIKPPKSTMEHRTFTFLGHSSASSWLDWISTGPVTVTITLSSSFNTKHAALNSWQKKRGPLIRYYRVLRASKEVNYPEVPSVAFSKRCPAAVVGAAGGKSPGGGPDSATHWPCDLPQEPGASPLAHPYDSNRIPPLFTVGISMAFVFSTLIHLLLITKLDITVFRQHFCELIICCFLSLHFCCVNCCTCLCTVSCCQFFCDSPRKSTTFHAGKHDTRTHARLKRWKKFLVEYPC